MFKAAKDGPAKVITANNLRDGLVVFLAPDGGWTHDIATAHLVEDGPDLDAAMERAREQEVARVVVEPYPIDVTVGGDGPVPVRLREKIRADRGPTIPYGAREVAKLAGGGA